MVANADKYFTSSPTRILRALLVLMAVGLGLGLYLTWLGLHGPDVAGCPDGGWVSCDEILVSRWAKWLGLPVGALAAVTYAVGLGATVRLSHARAFHQRRVARFLLQAVGVALIGAAMWFVGLQLVLFRKICPFCLAEHVIGIVAGVMMLGFLSRQAMPASHADPSSPTEPRRPARWFSNWMARGLGLGLVGVLIAGQFAFRPKPYRLEPLRPDSMAGTPARGGRAAEVSNPASPARPDLVSHRAYDPFADREATEAAVPSQITPEHLWQLDLYSQPELSAQDRAVIEQDAQEVLGGDLAKMVERYPTLGPADAPHVMGMVLDYGCGHCAHTYQMLEAARQRYGDQLAIVHFPAPNTSVEGRYALAKLGLALWRAKPSAYSAFVQALFEAGGLADAAGKAEQAAGSHTLRQAVRARRLDQQIQVGITLRSGAVPILIFGDTRLTGTIDTQADLYALLEAHLSIDPVHPNVE